MDAGQNTPATVVNEQQAAPVPSPPLNEKREFLQGMSPPSSPGGFPWEDPTDALASDNGPPLHIVSDAVAPETGNALPAVLPAMELGKGDGVVARVDGSVVAVPMVAPSNGGRRTGGEGELFEEGEAGESARVPERSVEQILQPGGSQVSLCLQY